MSPGELRAEQFRTYPPQAKGLVTAHLALLRQMPTIYAASLLREVIGYDWQFPAERRTVEDQLKYLSSLDREHLAVLFAGFAQIRLDRKLETMDWVKEPAVFSERLTAWLWSTHQIDAFRLAATEFAAKVARAVPVQPPAMPRLGIAVIGQGVERANFPLFRKLRPYGVHFTQADPANGMQMLVDAVAARAAKHPDPYAHWYIEGGKAAAAGPQVTTVSYGGLKPVLTRLLEKMREVIQSGSGGPELLEVTMATMSPQELGMTSNDGSGVQERFELNVLTQGSGTQIFSTTFVQWTAREALRRAEPVTLLARFTPRQRQRPMNEMLQGTETGAEADPQGSLIDADMGAYYIWLDQQRLAHADTASFLVWFEGHNEALAVSPGLPRGTVSSNPANLRQILQWIS